MNNHVGSTFESFLEEEGIRDEVYAEATKRVLAWQIDEARKALGMSKAEMARRMHTSRAAVDRVLDPANTSATLTILARAAAVVGKQLHIELADVPTPEKAAAQS